MNSINIADSANVVDTAPFENSNLSKRENELLNINRAGDTGHQHSQDWPDNRKKNEFGSATRCTGHHANCQSIIITAESSTTAPRSCVPNVGTVIQDPKTSNVRELNSVPNNEEALVHEPSETIVSLPTTTTSTSVSSEIMLKALFNTKTKKNSSSNTNSSNNNLTTTTTTSAAMYDTTTSSKRLASGLGLTKKETSQENVEFDLLYATKLSSISNKKSSRRHKKSTWSSSRPSREKMNQFCKYCKISERHLEKKNLSTLTQLKTCSLCREVRYCCKEHQVEDWPNHKIDCNSAVRARNNGIYCKTLKKGHSKYRPCEGDVVSIHYVARLLNGTIVDKTYKSIETNKYCSVSYDTSDDEDTENAFDDDNDPYIVKPPSNVYNDFEGWLSHANIQQRKSFAQHDDINAEDDDEHTSHSSQSDLTAATIDFSTGTSVTSSFYSEAGQSFLDEDQNSQRSTISSSSMISNPERTLEQSIEFENEAQDNWSDSSSGRAGGGTSSSTSNATIIFDSLQKDVEVVPDPLQFKIGKGQVPSGVEKAVKQMSLGERCYLVVAPSKESSKRDVISKRMKNANGYTIIYEIMLVHILRKRQYNEFDFENIQNMDSMNDHALIRLEEFTKDDDSYQSCYYEPFRPFLANVSSLSAQLY
ncbi:hypothetical protein C9374_005515 [Naegleria lovaniensis]|uniref:peptidylprolyl isomerase n=1 Tax=Naegleria lovaniensis TaxID=51637 RepID=A0AA88GPR9_NAELO|nr:uncharacterized protein C9374_005515 [Naegleria lovaniensis]KAG2382313.1 hypothetical protein C9374_005515 [Naegleria lovaniensis]